MWGWELATMEMEVHTAVEGHAAGGLGWRSAPAPEKNVVHSTQSQKHSHPPPQARQHSASFLPGCIAQPQVLAFL